jgi:uncharacterized phage-associated protein
MSETPKTYTAMTIAKWFVAWASDCEADLSNLKLQKLLYYAQGNHLAHYGRPLFGDPVEAWSHGPVVEEVYHAFKRFGPGEIQLDPDDPFDWSDVDEDTAQFLIEVWEKYGAIAAWRLRNMTHQEPPWVDHFKGGERNIQIPQADMKRYFKSLKAFEF